MSIKYKKRLIVFTRYPEQGTTKTRLIPVLGEKGAADLQRKMVENTLTQVRKLSTSDKLTLEIRYEGGNEILMKNWLGPDFVFCSQDRGDIGVRMCRAFEDAFKKGADAAVIIGTDIPDISHTIIDKAFNELKQKKMVVGPAKDGGYYLIGLQKNLQSSKLSNLFSGIDWGKGSVLKKTLEIVKSEKLSFLLLEALEDIDRPEDLPVLVRSQNFNNQNSENGHISVIIPVLNEADNIVKTLINIGFGNYKEIIVVDGGSNDGTVNLAKSLNVKIVHGSPPRARQMNLGAALATGNILLFLHGDTLVPERFDEYIINALRKSNVVAGGFELGIDSPALSVRLVEQVANWRSRRLGLPYGDQGLFITSELFNRLGGFCDIPIMEDFELVRRLRKKGKVVTLSVSAVTSARRWKRLGILKTTIINQMVIAAYFMGIAPDVIARLYHHGRKKLKVI